MRRTMIRVALVAVFSAIAALAEGNDHIGSHTADRIPADVASVWFDELYDVVKSEATSPPLASRIYGVAAVALYEAVVPGSERNRSLVGQLNGLSLLPWPKEERSYHWPTVANAAVARTIRGIFTSLTPENLAAVDALEASFNVQFQATVDEKQFERSVAQGKAIADAILAWAAADGFSTFNNCPYVPAPVAGAWQPTPPSFVANPLQPCWGEIRPMVLRSGLECPPLGHPAFSIDTDSDFYAAALEVYDVNLNLTDEQKTIASYWGDGAGVTGTPPGHWIAIVGQIARNDGLSLARAAEAYARVGIAVCDAFIECWNTKYIYNLQRPVTYIQTNIAATWLPFIVTPPFPTYTSGHSTQSGAAARILTDMFGIKAFTDTLHGDHHLVPLQAPRTFDSFDQAAAEAAVSRLYGGIHYSFDNNDGLASGRCIGQTIGERVRFSRHEEDDEDDD